MSAYTDEQKVAIRIIQELKLALVKEIHKLGWEFHNDNTEDPELMSNLMLMMYLVKTDPTVSKMVEIVGSQPVGGE